MYGVLPIFAFEACPDMFTLYGQEGIRLDLWFDRDLSALEMRLGLAKSNHPDKFCTRKCGWAGRQNGDIP